jgi:O-antigen/teichoic acid export membrane protein
MFSPKDKKKLLKGSAFVALRQVLASALSLVNVLVVARVLGPQTYGIVATSVGIFYFLKWTGRIGMHIYIMRKPDLQMSEVEQILGFYNTVGIATCILAWFLSPLSTWWTGSPEVAIALQILVPGIWLDMVGGLSIGLLERDLRFQESSLIEALSQVANYCISIPLVLLNWGYFGPIIGTLVQYLSIAIFAYIRCPIPWRWRWSWIHLEPALRYGMSYYSSNWIYAFKSLTIPLIVTRLGGLEVAGIATVSLRIVRQMEILRKIVNRMSISVMAKILDDTDRLLRTITKAMSYQALMMSLIFAGFASFSGWIIPTVFGEKWAESSQLFPLIAFSEIVGAVFDLHNATLYASGHNGKVAIRNLGYVVSLWLGTLVFIPIFGVIGYGLAEIFALPSFYFIHTGLRDVFGSPSYRDTFWIILASIPSLAASNFLSPFASLEVFFVSFSLLFFMNHTVRCLPLELWQAIRINSKVSSRA